MLWFQSLSQYRAPGVSTHLVPFPLMQTESPKMRWTSTAFIPA